VTIKEVSSVIDDINEWNGPNANGTVYYVTVMFTDGTVGSVGRKDHDAALEVQGLLREAIGVAQDFTLESKGQTKTGRDKFNIKGFGTPGGAATYAAPGVQGGGGSGGSGTAPHHRSPEPSGGMPYMTQEQVQERMDRRTALMQAVGQTNVVDIAEWPGVTKVLDIADTYYSWLRETSEPALGAYEPVEGSPSPPQAGVGSEDRGEEASEGEAEASSPHQHDWQMRQGVKGFLVCEGCGKTRKRETA